MLKELILTLIPWKIVNFVKRLLIYFPFEKGSNFNGETSLHFRFIANENNAHSVCVFSHYDAKHRIEGHIVHYIESIYNEGFDIIFVSTSLYLPTSQVNKISKFCRHVLVKENIGYDFGAWKTGLECLGTSLNHYRSLLLCNDSVYGPLYSLSEMFSTMNNRYDFWGVTDSLEVTHHLQSYFMVFSKKAICDPAFKNFWKSYKIYKIKRNIVLQNEIGLSKKLKNRGYTQGAYCNYADLKISRPRNSSHYYWRDLITQYRVPFIKVELLKKNPKQINTKDWEYVLEQHTRYNVELIKQHYI